MRVYLLGRRSNKTPFYYASYRDILNSEFEYCVNPHSADFLILGTVADIEECKDIILSCLRNNSEVRLIVLSEEPYWDLMWGGNYTSRENVINLQDCSFKYTYLNHCTSNIFSFNKLPYFITTDNVFFTRYAMLFARNAVLSKSCLQEYWELSQYHYAAIAQHRLSNNSLLDLRAPMFGLSDFRTRFTEGNLSELNYISGKGWPVSSVRQSLPDWHLEKLATLDRKCRFISALENTHHENYISEKIFDAFALLAIPVYFSSSTHQINQLVPNCSFLNLYCDNIDESLKIFSDFLVSDDFFDRYMLAQKSLHTLFSEIDNLTEERKRVCAAIKDEFDKINNDF